MTGSPAPSLLRSKFFWVGILYFAQGFPAGVFYEIFPGHFRSEGSSLTDIGFLSLLGLAWTLKFLWAPAITHYRRHRRWMFVMDALMALQMAFFAAAAGVGEWVWIAVGMFTIFSATNDIAIDGYTIEMLNKDEMGFANGLRIGFYRVGLLSTGVLLMMQGQLGWSGVYLGAAILLLAAGYACLQAPKEKDYEPPDGMTLKEEVRAILASPFAFSAVVLFLLGTLWMANKTAKWSETYPDFWLIASGVAAALIIFDLLAKVLRAKEDSKAVDLSQGPMFGALLDMMKRPGMLLVLFFILTFKLADTSMGFMVKPFWVDAGFTPAQIGLVSVNIGIGLSVLGGLTGGWITDRIGIFHALWSLGLAQAVSNLGYAWVASVLPVGPTALPDGGQQIIMYAASGLESFTQGLGTAAFLAFLMAIVNKRRSATEYALLSAIFILSRSVAGWAGGYGAEAMGYADYFLLTFFLAFPAYLLLPWVKRMLAYAESQKDWDQS
ncbi:MAG: MFS transporter [Gammaproteobacteria bacterium]|nr:MFS transporter [Gammaproteobacteria bacterium]